MDADRKAAAPRIAKSLSGTEGINGCTKQPTMKPLSAPRAKPGVKRPPTAPERKVTRTAIAFAISRMTAKPSSGRSMRTVVAAIRPLPKTSGTHSEITPTSVNARGMAQAECQPVGALSDIRELRMRNA